jgi:hypothetical protein
MSLIGPLLPKSCVARCPNLVKADAALRPTSCAAPACARAGVLGDFPALGGAGVAAGLARARAVHAQCEQALATHLLPLCFHTRGAGA